MTVQSHIEALAKKHANLEHQLSEAQGSPSTDDATIRDIKRKKLHLKDHIEGLRATV